MGCVAMSLGAVWAVMRWLYTSKKRYGVFACITMILAILVRQNMIIVTIALAIILGVICVRSGKNECRCLFMQCHKG